MLVQFLPELSWVSVLVQELGSDEPSSLNDGPRQPSWREMDGWRLWSPLSAWMEPQPSGSVQAWVSRSQHVLVLWMPRSWL